MASRTANGLTTSHPRRAHNRSHVGEYSAPVANVATGTSQHFVNAEKTNHGLIIWRVLCIVVKVIFRVLTHPVRHPLEFVQFVNTVRHAGWQEGVSSAMCAILAEIDKPLAEFGQDVEDMGNELLGKYKFDDGITEVDRTIIGLLDTEVPALRKSTLELFPSPTPGSRPNGDVCISAAKIIYEDDRIVEDIINNVWNKKAVVNGKVIALDKPLDEEKKFKFVQWFNFPSKQPASASNGERRVDTQAMIFKKGHAIVLAFRGTQPWSAVDWGTDFYFPWWELPAVGRVHTGFLQALGLGSPQGVDPPGTVPSNELREEEKLLAFGKYMKRHVKDRMAGDGANSRKEGRKTKNEGFKNEYAKETLYFELKDRLQELLDEDPRNHLFITGHSLGGALAALFTGLLVAESDAMEKKISGLFTFGQPRIGDWTFAWFLHSRLNGPQHRYVRMIYGNDLVPRVPFDTDLFEFKHLGPFHWVDTFYHIRIGTFEDQPRLNVFTAHFRAIVELWYNTAFNSFANKLRAPEKQRPTEGFFQKLSRWAILALPGLPMLGAHSPVNYVNGVRYGMPEGKVKETPAPAAASG